MTWLALLALAGTLAGALRILFQLTHPPASASPARRWIGPLCLAAGMAVLAVAALASADAQRLVAKLVMPIGLIWMGLAMLTAWCWTTRRRVSAIAATLLFAAYSLAGSNPVGAAAIASLERCVPMGDALAEEPFDAVFVLGGGSVRRADGVPELGQEGDRLVLAASLYLNHRTPVLVASGDFAEDTAWLWGRLGIPKAAVIAITAPRNTGEEIAAYLRLIQERGWKRVGLVSSAWHLPRALRLCARQGARFEPLPCDWLGAPPQWSAQELIPQLEGFHKSHLAAWEYLGMRAGH